MDAGFLGHDVPFPRILSISRSRIRRTGREATQGRFREQEDIPMPHPVIHAEIRSADPDATRRFYADLFDWKVASEGGFPGYTFIDTGAEGGAHVAISPRQGSEDEVLFFVAVDDVAGTLKRAEELGGSIVQSAQEVPGVTFAVFADRQGHKIGVASNG
jgi:uncharacterized protein